MKYVWELDDIKSGVFFHRGFEEGEIPGDGYQYALSTLAKIGRLSHFDEGAKEAVLRANANGDTLYLAIAMSDGMSIVKTAQELVNMLNDGGYRRTTKADMVAMVSSAKSTAYMRLL